MSGHPTVRSRDGTRRSRTTQLTTGPALILVGDAFSFGRSNARAEDVGSRYTEEARTLDPSRGRRRRSEGRRRPGGEPWPFRASVRTTAVPSSRLAHFASATATASRERPASTTPSISTGWRRRRPVATDCDHVLPELARGGKAAEVDPASPPPTGLPNGRRARASSPAEPSVPGHVRSRRGGDRRRSTRTRGSCPRSCRRGVGCDGILGDGRHPLDDPDPG